MRAASAAVISLQWWNAGATSLLEALPTRSSQAPHRGASQKDAGAAAKAVWRPLWWLASGQTVERVSPAATFCMAVYDEGNIRGRDGKGRPTPMEKEGESGERPKTGSGIRWVGARSGRSACSSLVGNAEARLTGQPAIIREQKRMSKGKAG